MAKRGQRSGHWWNEPPKWAGIVIILCAVILAVGLPIALQERRLSQAEIDAAEARAAESAASTQPDLPVAAFLGDSYTVGLGAADDEGYVQATASAMGWQPVNLGQSGTGFTTPGPPEGEGAIFLDRVDEVVAAAPAVVIVQGGTNDTTADVEAAATELFAQLRGELPDAVIVAVGPEDPPEKDAATIAASSAAIARAAQASGVPFIDPIAGGWLTDDSDFADRLHPTDDGYAIYSERLVAELRAVLPAP